MADCPVSEYFRQPGLCNFTIKGNVAWHPVIYLYSDSAGTIPVDLTGWTPIMEIRDSSTLVLIMTVATSVVSLTGGSVLLALTKAQTKTLNDQNPMPAMMYDLDFYSATPDSFTALSGAITIDPGYTVP